MSTDAVLATLREVWSLLRGSNVPAALAGGLALAAWRHVRTTRDVDLVVGIDLQMATELQTELKSAGFRLQKSDPPSILFNDEFGFLTPSNQSCRIRPRRRSSATSMAMATSI